MTPALVEQRAATRHRVFFATAKVHARGGRSGAAVLHDLSVYGCRLACRTRYAQGMELWVQLPGEQAVAATVVWNDGDHIGCRFGKPIPRAAVRALTLVIR